MQGQLVDSARRALKLRVGYLYSTANSVGYRFAGGTTTHCCRFSWWHWALRWRVIRRSFGGVDGSVRRALPRQSQAIGPL